MFPKLVEQRGNIHVIKDQLPTIFHHEGTRPGEVIQTLRDTFAAYRATLPPTYQSLLDSYTFRDAAIKMVGVGSVGTMCWVFLFTTGDGDPLFLQVKEARASVLEPYAGRSVFANHGERVVDGYRRMQPASDMFLGWSQGPKRHFFIRQLRDLKLSVMVETFGQAEMDIYAARGSRHRAAYLESRKASPGPVCPTRACGCQSSCGAVRPPPPLSSRRYGAGPSWAPA